MTVTVSFNEAQAQLDNGDTGVQLSQVILPYSIRNSEDATQYLGGQMTLGQSDGIKFTDNTKDWERIGLAKIKNMVADAELYVPAPIVEAPASSEVEAPVSSAEASEDTVATSVSSEASEAPASSEEAPVSSASMVASSADDLAASSEATVVSSAPVTEAPVEASVTEVQ